MVKGPPLAKVLCLLTPLLRGTWTLELLILVNLVACLTHVWHEQGYGVESHPEAIHQALIGVPCGQVSEGDGYLQPSWWWLAKSCLLLLYHWDHSFHQLCKAFWRQSDKISATICIRIQQLVHQNFILAKEWPLQDPVSKPTLSVMPTFPQWAKSRRTATFCTSKAFCHCSIAPNNLNLSADRILITMLLSSSRYIK